MTNPIVHLNGIGDVAYLQAAGGSVIQDHDRLVLQGNFSLLVMGVPSIPVTFGAQGLLRSLSMKVIHSESSSAH